MFELALAVAFVVITSAMCSLFEAVLYSVPLSQVEALAQSGRRSGRMLQRLRDRIDEPITAILSLNTISNTGGAAIAGALAATALQGYSESLFPALFTLTILFVSEIIPKTAGVIYCRPLAPVIAVPLQLLVWVFTPFIWLSRFVTRLVARGAAEQQVSEEDISSLARAGVRSGGVHADRGRVIQNVLSLGSKLAQDVMTPRTVVFALPCGLTVEEARQHRELLFYSRIPLYDKDPDDIVGIVHRRDILSASADNKSEVALEKLMRPVHFVIGTMALDRVLPLFLDGHQHMFVTLDEFGGFAGVVTLEDVLEEILGTEIVDEFDEVTDMRELAHQRRQQVIEESMRAAPRGS